MRSDDRDRPRGEGAEPSAAMRPKDGDAALERLIAGNRRFVNGTPEHRARHFSRLVEVADRPEPYAIVLGCADSRVPPEVVFDEGVGDLFTVRVAGNSATAPVVAGSIEYAAAAFGSVLLVVLGHEECGAVRCAVDVVREGAAVSEEVWSVVEPIVPAVRAVAGAPESELLDRAVAENIRRQVQQLESACPPLTDLVNRGTLKVVGGEFHLETGRVEIVVP